MIVSRRAANRMVKGQLTVIFKPEKERPRVEQGKHYPIQPRNKTGKGQPDPSIGRFRVKSSTLVRYAEITQNDAQAAGFSTRLDLHRYLEAKLEGPFPDTTLFWRVEWEIIQVEDRRAA